ncbi:MAG: hypothetical protein ACXVAF_16095 [Vulcanimicrobiaceae bacterium]
MTKSYHAVNRALSPCPGTGLRGPDPVVVDCSVPSNDDVWLTGDPSVLFTEQHAASP